MEQRSFPVLGNSELGQLNFSEDLATNQVSEQGTILLLWASPFPLVEQEDWLGDSPIRL